LSILKAAPAGKVKRAGRWSGGGRAAHLHSRPRCAAGGHLGLWSSRQENQRVGGQAHQRRALSCVFCSVNAGPQSRARWAEYVVEAEALLSALATHTSAFRFYLNPAYT